ncbi:MAG TPA: alpha/beta fold hydrolase [Intrasporangiaceae bacterium]|nr:alpha/beta fold hydrolase [Intrasporangiaceae bacterium]
MRCEPGAMNPSVATPAVFLHGVGGAGPSAWPTQAPLARERECLFVDRIAAGDDPDRTLDWVRSHAPDRFHLVGHSYGGAVAMLVAAAEPQRVVSMVLIDPAALAVCPGATHTAAHIGVLAPVFARAEDPDLTNPQFSELFGQATGNPPPPLPDDQLDALVDHLRAVRPPWEVAVDGWVVARIPTLVVVGDADPMYAEVGSALAACGAEMVEHTGLGHRPHDDPGITERIRAHWLAVEGVA